MLHYVGPAFMKLIDQYLQPALHKGVPSLFMGLQDLYKDPEKVMIVHAYLHTLVRVILSVYTVHVHVYCTCSMCVYVP